LVARAEESDEDKDKEKDKEKSKAEDDEEKDKDKDKDKEKSKAEDDEEKDKEKDDDKDKEKSKASASISRRSNEDGDRADAGDPVTRAARDRQRGMMKAVLDSEPGKAAFKANPDKVVRFLVGFPGTRQEAISTLELFGGNEAPKASLQDRLAAAPEVPTVGPGSGEERRRSGNMANPEDIIRAGRIRRGEAAA
jgi:hypothetical protein